MSYTVRHFHIASYEFALNGRSPFTGASEQGHSSGFSHHMIILGLGRRAACATGATTYMIQIIMIQIISFSKSHFALHLVHTSWSINCAIYIYFYFNMMVSIGLSATTTETLAVSRPFTFHVHHTPTKATKKCIRFNDLCRSFPPLMYDGGGGGILRWHSPSKSQSVLYRILDAIFS